MRHIKKIILIPIFLIVFLFLDISHKVEAEGMDFSVEAILPDNQVDVNESYFDLLVRPNSNQTLSFKVANLSDKPSQISIDLNPGWTNQNGVLSYSKTDKKTDESMAYPITQLIKDNNKLVELKPFEEKIVNFELVTPTNEFDGIIVGGFIFKKIKENNRLNKNTSEVVIDNDIQLVKGIKLSENNKKIPEVLNIKEAKAGVVNYRNAFILNFQNSQPRFIRDINVQMVVKKENSNDVLISENKKINSMAPNSNVDLPIIYQEEIKPGNYVMEIDLQTTELKEHKALKFEVTKKEYKEIKNELIKTGSHRRPNYKLIIIVSIVLMILVLVGLLISLTKGRSKKRCKRKK